MSQKSVDGAPPAAQAAPCGDAPDGCSAGSGLASPPLTPSSGDAAGGAGADWALSATARERTLEKRPLPPLTLPAERPATTAAGKVEGSVVEGAERDGFTRGPLQRSETLLGPSVGADGQSDSGAGSRGDGGCVGRGYGGEEEGGARGAADTPNSGATVAQRSHDV